MSYLIRNTSSMLHPEIRALEGYWQDLRAGRVCPFRAEVDPRDIPSRIGNLFILEDVGLGNVRFRISGTALTDAFGMELRGMPVGSIMDISARQSFAELLKETLAEPGVGHARLRSATGRGEIWEILLLPLRSDTGRVDRVIGAMHPLEERIARVGEPPLRFTIEAMSIVPVEITAEARETSAVGGGGFAESAANFSGPAIGIARAGRRPSLVAIPGGRPSGDGGGPPPAGRPRPRLRVVTSH